MEALTLAILQYIDLAKSRRYVIEEDELVGFYLYVYDLLSEKCIKDHMQDSLAIAQDQAYEDYGVPISDWVQVV